MSFINFKGGVGKTTLAFQVGCYIANLGEKVLLIDVDHQSSLSVTVMGKDWDKAVSDKKTIDQIFKSISGNSLMPGNEIIHEPESSLHKGYPNLRIVPSALSLDETEIELTSTTVGDPILSEWRKRTLICEWLNQNSIDEAFDYVIFDCPPATKIVTQNALAASHGFVVPTIPDAVSVRGTPHLTNQMMNKIESQFNSLSGFLKTKGMNPVPTFVSQRKFIGIVISRARTTGGRSGYTNDATENMNLLRQKYKDSDFIDPVIKEGVGVSESMTMGWPVYDFPTVQNIGGQGFISTYENVSQEIKDRIDNI